MSDTIFALSTAPGRAGVAVVRVSGVGARIALAALTGRSDFEPRHATRAPLRDVMGSPLDDALVLWFPSPASFTGEDIAEFHIHGGRAILDGLLAALYALPALRPATAGEFTRRAVENGKLDLTRAEALADLIDAETDSQRRQALRQYGGALAALCDGWRDRLVRAAAWAEASIDFADEEVPQGAITESRRDAATILDEIRAYLLDSHRGEIIRNGVHLTLFGNVNAGKSSLLNALAQRDVAIVSPIPGTTRDVIAVHLDLGGYAVIVSDTAGLRTTNDPVEAEGVRRARDQVDSSDITVLVLEGAVARPYDGIDPDLLKAADLIVWNKSDVVGAGEGDAALEISTRTGQGVDVLIKELAKIVQQRLEIARDSPLLTRARHRHALEDAAAALTRALPARDLELMAEDFRLALRALGRITGRVDIEDLLDVVFRDFCIGK
ncbi:MAG TPA: tRNA uridine-5-carboxymethylaminomethyl(34) synthesis GTPase MnmE [Rhizomicrobium sp.]|nr:tRNA uridine-5-carboxymethylaminomethyl(34) synthesis GTPase MnmE [Rhizomicrobium sp.]